MPKFAVILHAAGRSTPFRDKLKKPFVNLDGRAIWIRAAEAFINRDDVCQTLLVVSPEDREKFQDRFAANLAFMGITVVDGGSDRVDSVANALARVVPEADFVAVHDAARPCMITDWVDAVFAQAAKSGAAILPTPLTHTRQPRPPRPPQTPPVLPKRPPHQSLPPPHPVQTAPHRRRRPGRGPRPQG